MLYKGSDSKKSACNAGDPGSVSELGRSCGERNGYPLQYSCLGNAMDNRAWWTIQFMGSQRVTFPHLICKDLGEFIEQLKPENLLSVSINFLNVKMRVLFQ